LVRVIVVVVGLVPIKIRDDPDTSIGVVVFDVVAFQFPAFSLLMILSVAENLYHGFDKYWY
jgi:hypothetical protein